MISALLTIIIWLAAFEANAQSTKDNILINARDLTYNSETSTTELKGDVQLVHEGQHIQSDYAIINFEQKTIEATGFVRIRSQDLDIEADRAIIDYKNNLGTFYNAFIKSGQVEFQGKVIHKTGKKDYIIVDGQYTACRSCPPAWSFSGQHIEAELGGYARIKNPVISFGNVPVLWLPFLMVPLKSERQSGLLFPTFEFGSGSSAFGQRFFWAINRSQDMTLTGKFYVKRGVKLLTNYRYVLTNASRGEVNAGYINDSIFPDEIEKYRPHKKAFGRWFFDYRHFYNLPKGYVHRADINLLSDLRYQNDFPLEFENTIGDPALENRVSLSQSTQSTFRSIEIGYYVNLLKSNPISENSDAVHRFPEIRYSITNQRIKNTNLRFQFDLNYVNFSRSNFTYDDNNFVTGTAAADPDKGLLNDPVDANGNKTCSYFGSTNTSKNLLYDRDPACDQIRDGHFDSNRDFIRTGQRFDIQPTLSYPIRIGRILDLVPKIGYRETRYAFGVQPRPNVARRYLRLSLDARSTLSRIYGGNDKKSNRMKHEIQPIISITRIPEAQFLSEQEHPFFRREATSDVFNSQLAINNSQVFTNDLDRRSTLQFDYNDRIYDRHLYTIAIRNKLITKKWAGDVPEYKQVASILLKQSYDANAAKIKDSQPYSNLVVETLFSVGPLYSLTTLDYLHSEKVSNINSNTTYTTPFNNTFGLAYTLTFDPAAINLWNARKESITFSTGFISKYLDMRTFLEFNGNARKNINGVSEKNNRLHEQINRWGYIATIKPPGNCWSIFVQDSLSPATKKTNLRFMFSFIFDGKTSTGFGTDDWK